MATLNQNKDVRLLQAGLKVSRAAATLPQTVQNGGTAAIFTISGGRVLLTSLVGSVVTALGSTTSTLSLGYVNNQGGTSTTILGTAGTASSALVGAQFVSVPGGALITDQFGGSAASTGAAVASFKSPFLLNPGSITVSQSAANTPTGTVKWDCTYTPYDDGGQIAAA